MDRYLRASVSEKPQRPGRVAAFPFGAVLFAVGVAAIYGMFLTERPLVWGEALSARGRAAGP